MYTVICQKWEESERGWGSRPDGFSLHLTKSDLQVYIKKYWDTMPDDPPIEYSRPDGTPYNCQVAEETFKELLQATEKERYGLRFNANTSAPLDSDGKQGVDGWRFVKFP